MPRLGAARRLSALARRLTTPGAFAKRPLPIVMYHAVDERTGPHTVSPNALRRQLDVLMEHVRVIPLREVPKALTEPLSERPLAALTFDDAYRDFAEEALPALAERGLQSTLFVPTASIGAANTWDPPAAGGGRPILSADEIRNLVARGDVEIGSHGVNHVRMSTLPPAEIQHQARASKVALETLIGQPVECFAYPFGQLGDFSATSTRVLAEAGYRLAVTTHWGTYQDPHSPLTLRRIHFNSDDTPVQVRAKLAGDHDWRTWKERGGYTWRRLRAAAYVARAR